MWEMMALKLNRNNNKEIFFFINFTIGTIYLNGVLLFSNKNVDIKFSAHDAFLE